MRCTHIVHLSQEIVHLQSNDKRIHWCLERLNYADWDYSCFAPCKFYFASEADAVLFALTWVGKNEI